MNTVFIWCLIGFFILIVIVAVAVLIYRICYRRNAYEENMDFLYNDSN